MIRILVVDDNEQFLVAIRHLLSDILAHSEFCDYQFEIKVVHDPTVAKRCFQELFFNIVLLDINMPKLNGFELASQFKYYHKDTKIIFVTNYDSMVFSSFRYNPFRFIRKKHLKDELPEAICAALHDLYTIGNSITLGKRYEYKKILLSDILYVESKKNYVEIVTSDFRYTHRETLTSLSEKWSQFGFYRVRAAFLINVYKLKMIQAKKLYMEDGTEIVVSKKYRDQIPLISSMNRDVQ